MPGASLFPEVTTPSQQAGWINAHCDGGARGNPGPAGFGAVLADAEGLKLAELSEFLGHRTNNFAEYSGLLAVLGWALEHDHRRLRVVSDSELMVKQIQGRYKVNSPDLRPLWEEARRRIAKLEGFEISHALRHKNKDADRLANEAMDRGMGKAPAVPPRILREAGATGAGARTGETPGALRTHVPEAGHGAPSKVAAQKTSAAKPSGQMLRGFTRGGAVHLLGGAELPDGIFVKVIPE